MAGTVVVGLLVGILLGLVLLPLVVGVLLGLLLGAAPVAVGWLRADALASGTLPTRGPDPDADARLLNLVDGLCVTVGIDPPTLLVVESDGVNAGAVGRDPTAARLLITSGLLEKAGRVELEGVLARELRRIKEGQVAVATLAVPFAAVPARVIPPLRAVLAPAAGTVDDVFLDDRATVEVTRYPPGLAGALVVCRDAGSAVPGVPEGAAHLWLAETTPGAGTHPSLDDRIAALREL